MFFFIKNNFDQQDHDVIIDPKQSPTRPHPFSVEFFFNRLVFRSCHIPSEDQFSPQFEILEPQLVGLFKDKPLLHEALNTALLQRYKSQFKEIKELHDSRKKVVMKKMSKY